jgi:SSS family solute:Na+ symporter/sodium/proline symporter
LSLVSNAWAGFGAAFGPIILLSLYWRNMTRHGALAGMITGAVTVLFWIYAPIEIAGEPLGAHLYEIVPGFVLSTLAAVGVSLITVKPSAELLTRHDDVIAFIDEDGQAVASTKN